MSILQDIKQTVQEELEELRALAERVDEQFVQAVELICSTPGKVILTGLGKSGAIARKIAATLTSTGTPAVFIHPVEGAHGDFGLVQQGDVAILISKSGTGDELQTILPFLSAQGIPIIAITGDPKSLLARSSTFVLDAAVSQEACPNNLAPTSSTTVALVIGDALAVAALKQKRFTSDDFARLHPGGALGRKLLFTVQDVIRSDAELPLVSPGTPLAEIIMEITAKRFGAAIVLDEQGRVEHLITDGDLRRLMEGAVNHTDCTADDFPHTFPKTVSGDTLAAVALQMMKRHKINQLVVVDEEKRPRGIVHLHDILQAGIL
ncbi:MAG: KpsF/GutQ family sugar-phosphate isomerase [Candidatus Delongbacteria bacterium]|nr:KpsF/GutQ family sugar-phosphate isomerase [Candidatus Delongbacteria bacterium]